MFKGRAPPPHRLGDRLRGSLRLRSVRYDSNDTIHIYIYIYTHTYIYIYIYIYIIQYNDKDDNIDSNDIIIRMKAIYMLNIVIHRYI